MAAARKARAKKKRMKFTPFDSVDHLKTEEDIRAYLEAVFEEAADDPEFIAVALGKVARARGLLDLAKETGLTRQGLDKAFSAGGNPRLGTLVKVLKALGLKLEVKAA